MSLELDKFLKKATSNRASFNALFSNRGSYIEKEGGSLSPDDLKLLNELLDKGTYPITAQQYLEYTSGMRTKTDPPGVWKC
jgi:hypothetical protein